MCCLFQSAVLASELLGETCGNISELFNLLASKKKTQTDAESVMQTGFTVWFRALQHLENLLKYYWLIKLLNKNIQKSLNTI